MKANRIHYPLEIFVHFLLTESSKWLIKKSAILKPVKNIKLLIFLPSTVNYCPSENMKARHVFFFEKRRFCASLNTDDTAPLRFLTSRPQYPFTHTPYYEDTMSSPCMIHNLISTTGPDSPASGFFLANVANLLHKPPSANTVAFAGDLKFAIVRRFSTWIPRG